MVSKKSAAGWSGTKNESRNRAETPDTQAQPPISFEEFLGFRSNGSFLEICRRGSPEEIAEAIAKGTDIKDENYFGAPLFNAALFNNNPGAITVLLEAGADIEARNRAGFPILICAIAQNISEVVQVLLRAGADVEARIKSISMPDEDPHPWEGYTPLMVAATNNASLEIVQMLLEAGAELNVQDSDGWTPLICAARKNPDVLLLLLEAGADANLTDNEGRRAVDYARKNEKFKGTDALRMLERASSI